MSRRRNRAILLAALMSAALSPSAIRDALAHERLTVVTWGGAYTRSQVLAYFWPYTEETGLEIDIEHYSGGLERIREQVESLNIEWDVVDLTLSDVIRGCEEGLLEPFDHAVLPNGPDGTPAREDFVEGTLVPCGVGEILWSTVMAFDERRFNDDKPARIADFWDVRRFPGPRAMRRVPQKNLEWALIADDVARGEVYDVLASPGGVDRAFRSLDRIKGRIVWWDDGDEPAKLLADGEVVMATIWNGRAYDAVVNDEAPIATVWTDSIWDIDLWGIVRHTRNRERAVDFIKFATATSRLAEQAKHIAYGPARKSSLALIDEELERFLPSRPENRREALQFDSRWWAAHQAELDRRFEAWLEEPTAKPEQLPR